MCKYYKPMKNLLKFVLWVSLVGVLQPSLAQNPGEGVVVDKIIAKVNDYIVLKSELEATHRQFIEQNGTENLPPNLYCYLLQQLIVNKMMVAKAEIDSVNVDEVQVESNLNRRMDYFVSQFGSPEKLEQAYGKSLSQLKEELRPQIQEQMIAQKMQGEITKDIKVTPRQVKKYFGGIPKDSVPFLPSEVEVGQVVKFPTVSKSVREVSKQRLLEYRRQVQSGEANFEDLAKRHSEDLGSASRGGNLGFMGRGELVPPYEAAALAMEPGQISDPVESEFGIHLIQLLDRRGNRYNSRHILLRPEPTAEDVERTVQYLDSIRGLVLRGNYTFEKAANEFSDDKVTKVQGGMLKGQDGGTQLAKEELEYAVFMTVDTMRVGGITRAAQYRTEDGKTAVRIMWFKNKVEPHTANLKDDYQKIYLAALNREKARILDEWFVKTRGQLFIDIDKDYDYCGLLKEFGLDGSQ
jgi:peptidyl-prolyl cis-trans isomerase SurA